TPDRGRLSSGSAAPSDHSSFRTPSWTRSGSKRLHGPVGSPNHGAGPTNPRRQHRAGRWCTPRRKATRPARRRSSMVRSALPALLVLAIPSVALAQDSSAVAAAPGGLAEVELARSRQCVEVVARTAALQAELSPLADR